MTDMNGSERRALPRLWFPGDRQQTSIDLWRDLLKPKPQPPPLPLAAWWRAIKALARRWRHAV